MSRLNAYSTQLVSCFHSFFTQYYEDTTAASLFGAGPHWDHDSRPKPKVSCFSWWASSSLVVKWLNSFISYLYLSPIDFDWHSLHFLYLEVFQQTVLYTRWWWSSSYPEDSPSLWQVFGRRSFLAKHYSITHWQKRLLTSCALLTLTFRYSSMIACFSLLYSSLFLYTRTSNYLGWATTLIESSSACRTGSELSRSLDSKLKSLGGPIGFYSGDKSSR